MTSLPEPKPAALHETKVFISYSRRDIAFVDRLVLGLEAHRICPLVDRTDIYALEAWWARIETLIAAADTVIFVLSPDSLASDICRKEVRLAQELGKRLAPIVSRPVAGHADAIPQALGALNFIFFDAPHAFDDAMARLVAALATDIAWIREHTRLGELASRWREHAESEVLLLRGQDLLDAERWLARHPAEAPPPSVLHRAFIERSRDQANDRQRAVRSAVQSCNDTIVGIVHKFRDQEGIPQSVILGSLQSAFATVSSIPAEEQKDAELRRALGFVLAELALAQLSGNDVDGALAAASRAVEIFEALSRLAPQDLGRRADLFAGLDRWGDALLAAGRLEDASLAYGRNRTIATDTLADEADVDKGPWRTRLSIALEKTGDVGATRHDWEPALADYRSSLACRQAIADEEPGNCEAQRDLALMQERIGDASLALGRLEEAEAAYASSLCTTRRVCEASPRNAAWQRELAVALQRLADIHLAQGKTDAACATFEESYAITERLTAIDGSNVGWRLDGLRTLDRLGRARERAGDRAAALDAFRRGATLARALAKDEPARADWRAVAGFGQNICRLLLETVSANEALRQAQADAALLETAPASDAALARRARGWNNVAWYALLAQDAAAAGTASARALELRPVDLQILLNRIHVLAWGGSPAEAKALAAAARPTDEDQRLAWDAAIASDLQVLQANRIDIRPLAAVFGRAAPSGDESEVFPRGEN